MCRSIWRGVEQIMCSYKCIHILGELICCSYDLLVSQSDDTVNQKDGFKKKKNRHGVVKHNISLRDCLWSQFMAGSLIFAAVVAWKAFLWHSFVPLKCLSVPMGNRDEIFNFCLKNWKVLHYSQQSHGLVIHVTLNPELPTHSKTLQIGTSQQHVP